jgi:hypothetical protein
VTSEVTDISELTIREAMIYVSEVVIKSSWGNDWFGQQRVREISRYKDIGVIGSQVMLYSVMIVVHLLMN